MYLTCSLFNAKFSLFTVYTNAMVGVVAKFTPQGGAPTLYCSLTTSHTINS
jgi:hypothetical protein